MKIRDWLRRWLICRPTLFEMRRTLAQRPVIIGGELRQPRLRIVKGRHDPKH